MVDPERVRVVDDQCADLQTLEGTVDSRRTKNLAEDVAEQLGVNDVQNNLRVQRQEQSGMQSASLGTTQGTQARGGSTADQSKSKQH